MGIFAWKNQSVGIYDPVKKIFRKPVNRYHIKGVADILGVLPNGQFLAIEVKAAKGVISEDQERFIENIEGNNGIGFVAKSLKEVVDKIVDFSQLAQFSESLHHKQHIINKYKQLEGESK